MFRSLAVQFCVVGGVNTVIGRCDPVNKSVTNGILIGCPYCEPGHDCRRVCSHRELTEIAGLEFGGPDCQGWNLQNNYWHVKLTAPHCWFHYA
jgi:hypothetical protein